VYEIFKEDKMMMWNLFKKHHYLTDKLNKASRCFIAKWKNQIIGFDSILPLPNGHLVNVWREHRLVILSDFQGLGIGNALSETVGEILLSEGKFFNSRTANKKLGEYRNKSTKWTPASTNGKVSRSNVDNIGTIGYNNKLIARICYSHKYIGKNSINILEKSKRTHNSCTALDK
jgi:GNAT superfamily N-acetyltransferase